jgi:PPOX class probable F420-dependent enzyme
MRLARPQASERLVRARIARLATTGGDGQPHLVPVTFAVDGDRAYIAIDHKPKTTTNLRRLANIRENPMVALLADHYDEDWDRLWWVRADGRARVIDEGPDLEHPLDILAAKYRQYREVRPAGPVIVIDIERVTGWSAT